MKDVYETLVQCVECVREKIDFVPKIALVLGSGLGGFTELIDVVDTMDYSEIRDFPTSTVEGHAGRFVFGYVGTVPVVCMQGRVHYYEGYPMSDVVLPIRLMKMLGAEILFLTNASGGIGQGMQAGDFMLITGQIASFVPSPLIGKNIEALGVRFPDMSQIYDKKLQQIVRKTACEMNLDLKQGTYIQLSGPQYESPQEVAMCRMLGADAVGMSTACEAVAAKHMGMRIVGISCISNLACGISPTPLSHEEVQKVSNQTAPYFRKLVYDSIQKMGTEAGI